MMVASVVLPVVLFAFAAWLNYRHEYAVADDRIERSLDILHEHTLKVFQTVERAIAEVNEIVRGMSDDDIRRDQLHLHERLKHIVDALPQVRAIFLIDRDGRPLVSSQLEYRATLTRASEASSTCTWAATSVPMSAMFSRRG